jgi:DNA-binding NtrC family response regulator
MPKTSPAERPSYSILVVDDEDEMRTVIRAFLAVFGHDVVEAKGGKDAKWHLANRPFDVVVTDLWMPDGSGLGLIQHIRHEHKAVSIVAMTGRLRTLLPPELTTGKDKLDAILEKPFPLPDLVEAVAAAGEHARMIAGFHWAAAQ